jgi:serine/threonine-protein kinase RsbW
MDECSCNLPDEPQLKLEMLSQPRLLAAARSMVSNLAERIGFGEPHCSQIALAVDEALCNVINHGYDRNPDGKIWLTAWASDTELPDPVELRIMIEDRAKQVDPELIRSRDLDDIRPGGLGVFIIREVMDEVHYAKREGGGMRLTMRKVLRSTSSCPSAESPASGTFPWRKDWT